MKVSAIQVHRLLQFSYFIYLWSETLKITEIIDFRIFRNWKLKFL